MTGASPQVLLGACSFLIPGRNYEKVEVPFAAYAANFADLIAALMTSLGGSREANPPQLESGGFGGASPPTRGKGALLYQLGGLLIGGGGYI